MLYSAFALLLRPLPLSPRHPPPLATAATATSSSPELAAAQGFGLAYAQAWRGATEPLRALLLPDASAETPVWKCADRSAFESDLGSAAVFFGARAPPALAVISCRRLGERRAQLTWSLSVEWPAMWRPRANLLGQTTLELSAPRADGTLGVAALREVWHQRPRDVLASQVLPKLSDVLSVYASPTAERVPMWPAGGGKGYELRRVPPLTVLQTEWTETGEMLYAEQAPLPPHYAYSGAVKRTEWCAEITPRLRSTHMVSRRGVDLGRRALA
jgi:hypothetical protein